MTIALLGSAVGADNADPGTVTFSPNVTAGSLLLGAVRDSVAATYGVTDNKTQTWNLIASDGAYGAWGYVKNAGAGATTVTMAGHGVALRKIVAEFSGLDLTSPFVAEDHSATGSGTSVASAGMVTTIADLLLVMMVVTGSDASGFAAGAGWTILPCGAASDRIALFYRIVTTTGTYAGAATLGGAVGWRASIASFKMAAAAGAGVVVLGGKRRRSRHSGHGAVRGYSRVVVPELPGGWHYGRSGLCVRD